MLSRYLSTWSTFSPLGDGRETTREQEIDGQGIENARPPRSESGDSTTVLHLAYVLAKRSGMFQIKMAPSSPTEMMFR
jgi:hypothetical protein